MTKLKLDLSPAEWEIMEVIWEGEKSTTVREVVDSAYPSGEKAYTTVQTLMNILSEKKVRKEILSQYNVVFHGCQEIRKIPFDILTGQVSQFFELEDVCGQA